MAKVMQWVGKNLSLGGLIRHSASAVGTVTNYAVQGVGYAASHLIDDLEKRKSIQDSCQGAGKAIDSGLTKGGAALGSGVNKTVQVASQAVGHASGGVAKMMGASDDGIAQAQKIGTVVGAVGVGLVAGLGVADAAVALAAVSGTAGAAATTSGLAALGGGSIAAGGGGMAAGLTVAHGIVAGGAVSGVATLNKDEPV